MDELTYIEVLGRHGEVAFRYPARAWPVRIGRGYDNDLILEDPYVAPRHVVLERSSAGDLEIVDAGSRNGIIRGGSRRRITRERIDPAARYRVGKTWFRVRSPLYPVTEELVEHGAAGLRELAAALTAVMAFAAVFLFFAWNWTSERIDLVKLAQASVLYVLGLFIWSGAWALASRLLLGEPRFAAHLTAAALALLGVFIADRCDYVAFAFSAPANYYYVAMFAAGVILAWGLWRQLSLVIRDPGAGAALAAVGVAAVCAVSLGLIGYSDRGEDLAHMAYLKAIKVPAVRLVEGSETGQFFREAGNLKAELEALKK